MAEKVALAPQFAVRATKRSLNHWLRAAQPAFEHSLALEMLDIFLLLFALCLATAAFYYSSNNETVPLRHFLEMRISVMNFLVLFAFLLGEHFTLSAAGLYYSRRLSTRKSEALDILKATTLGSVVLSIIPHFFHLAMVTPVFIGVFWLTSALLLTLCRFALRRLRP